jgi:hypothetical protein
MQAVGRGGESSQLRHGDERPDLPQGDIHEIYSLKHEQISIAL